MFVHPCDHVICDVNEDREDESEKRDSSKYPRNADCGQPDEVNTERFLRFVSDMDQKVKYFPYKWKCWISAAENLAHS